MRASLRWWHPLGRWTWPVFLAGALVWQRAAGEVPWATVDGFLLVLLVMVAIEVHDATRGDEWRIGAELVKLLGMVAIAVWLIALAVRALMGRL